MIKQRNVFPVKYLYLLVQKIAGLYLKEILYLKILTGYENSAW